MRAFATISRRESGSRAEIAEKTNEEAAGHGKADFPLRAPRSPRHSFVTAGGVLMQPEPHSAGHQARGADRRGQSSHKVLGIKKVLDAGEQLDIAAEAARGAELD